jgi:hypothetical protein
MARNRPRTSITKRDLQPSRPRRTATPIADYALVGPIDVPVTGGAQIHHFGVASSLQPADEGPGSASMRPACSGLPAHQQLACGNRGLVAGYDVAV